MDAPIRGLHSLLALEDRNGNAISCPGQAPPGSQGSASSLSDGSTGSPLDVEMTDFCLSNEIPFKNPADLHNHPPPSFLSPGPELTSSPRVGLDWVGTFAVDDESTSIDNWGQNMTLVLSGLQSSSSDQDSDGKVHSETRSVEMTDRSSGTSPDSAHSDGPQEEPPPEPPHSADQSSSEGSIQILRGSSFIVHEAEHTHSISLLELASWGSSGVLSDQLRGSALLPDVCEGLGAEDGAEPADVLPALGLTYILLADQTFLMEGDGGTAVPAPQHRAEDTRPPSLMAAGAHRTASRNAECSAPAAPAEGKTFLSGNEEPDMGCTTQTSTPVPSLSNKTYCLPSFAESPLVQARGDLQRPSAHLSKELQGSVASGSEVPPAVPARSGRAERVKFPKPNFSNIKSKIMSRLATPLRPAAVKPKSVGTLQTSETQAADSSLQKSSLAKTSSASAPSPSITLARNSQRKDPSIPGTPRARLSTNPEKAAAPKPLPRRWSATSSSSSNSIGNIPLQTGSPSTTKRAAGLAPGVQNQGHPRHANGKASPKEDAKRSVSSGQLDAQRRCQRISLVAPLAAVAGAAGEGARGRHGTLPSQDRRAEPPSPRTPAAPPRHLPPVSRLKAGMVGKDSSANASVPAHASVSTNTGVPAKTGVPIRSRLNTPLGRQKARLTEGSSAGPVGSTSRPPLQPPHPAVAVCRLPVRGRSPQPWGAPPASPSRDPRPECVEPAPSIQGRATRHRAVTARTKALPQLAKAGSSGTGCRSTASSQGIAPPPTRSTRTASGPPAKDLLRNLQLLSGCRRSAMVFRAVEPRPSQRNQRQPAPASGHPDLVPPEGRPRGLEFYRTLSERKSQTIQQLRNALGSNSRRFEAIAVVAQHLHAELEETMRQRKELAVELLTLREDLVSSAQSCGRLEQEMEQLQQDCDGVLQQLRLQHQEDLAALEDRLKGFYSAEVQKLQQTQQQEALRSQALMEEQLEELRSKHEAFRRDLEGSHRAEITSLNQRCEETLQELRQSHEQDMQTLEKTLKEAEATLSSQIEELTAENLALGEKLQEEERRRAMAEDGQRDSHTMYLEQELESLKVVLDIKNKQLHQQDRRLMQMDKLVEKNDKMDECLKKVQRENEDLKARMDRHAALSRQLSTEQAVLQESLQKETKVNKRLSMENEELQWKLHNGDLSSPRRMSPSSSSPALQSPRNSAFLSSPPLSPR